MALVMLPCEMPWWSTLQEHIENIKGVKNVSNLVQIMNTIHTMCNVGLDPDEPDTPDPKLFDGLKLFLTQDFSESDQKHFFKETLPTIANLALRLKILKPVDGFTFSLQQQPGEIEFSHEFGCSLIAHAFLSTFPKRTNKTHPTLQDFNFSYFFQHLNQKFQKSKLRSILRYFDVMKENPFAMNSIKISRQIMKGKEWLTIEDWMECTLPLCPLSIRHKNRIEKAALPNSLYVCFSSKKLGGKVLSDGSSRECIQFCTCPELLVCLLCVEALEDNEAILVEGLIETGKIANPRFKGIFEPESDPTLVNVCCMDAENYTRLPSSQYEEDNVLRELNKALLGFRQKQQKLVHQGQQHEPVTRRLSPIGESFSTTPTELSRVKQIQASKKVENQNEFGNRKSKTKFIAFGSSAELLPVCRSTQQPPAVVDRSHILQQLSSTSHDSSPETEDFFTARTSLPDYDSDENDEDETQRRSCEFETQEHRNSFAWRLREALTRAQSNSNTYSNSNQNFNSNSNSNSDSSSYAVGISLTGSSIGDPEIRMKRGGSRGFMLEEDSSLDQYSNGKDSRPNCIDKILMECEDKRRNKGGSSRYSFSTDYNSDLEDVYEQLSSWLEESGASGSDVEEHQKHRNSVIIEFASKLLKRTLSESFVGMPLVDEEGTTGDEKYAVDRNLQKRRNSMKVKMAARSLSLELAKHKHKLSHQLISAVKQDGLMSVVTGNWGCGSRQMGDPQLKLLIQWLAASVAGIPQLFYYTFSHNKLLKARRPYCIINDALNMVLLHTAVCDISSIILNNEARNNDKYSRSRVELYNLDKHLTIDTVCRLLVDRGWKVGQVVEAVLHYMHFQLHATDEAVIDESETLFDLLITNAHERCNSFTLNSNLK